jgi:hypothetical protein
VPILVRIWDVRKLQTLAGQLSDPRPVTSLKKNEPTEPSIPDFDYGLVTELNNSKKGSGLLRGQWPHDKSCSSAYWDPRGRQIVSTSYDDTLRCEYHTSSWFQNVPRNILQYGVWMARPWTVLGPSRASNRLVASVMTARQ